MQPHSFSHSLASATLNRTSALQLLTVLSWSRFSNQVDHASCHCNHEKKMLRQYHESNELSEPGDVVKGDNVFMPQQVGNPKVNSQQTTQKAWVLTELQSLAEFACLQQAQKGAKGAQRCHVTRQTLSDRRQFLGPLQSTKSSNMCLRLSKWLTSSFGGPKRLIHKKITYSKSGFLPSASQLSQTSSIIYDVYFVSTLLVLVTNVLNCL